jgi:IS605 OrfB family transposase
MKDKISKEELEIKRLIPINIQGEKLQKANRSFKLDIIEINQIIFKIKNKKHIEFKLPNLRNNIKNELFKLLQLNEVKYGINGYTYSIRFDLKYIYISFEEFKKEELKQLNENRCLGIDMNPENIGVSILENNEVIHTQEFSLKSIFDKIFNEKLSSDSDRMKYLQNKISFETIEISKSIAKMAKEFNCYSMYIEDLGFKQNVDNKHNKVGNRKCRNLWKRDKFVLNLTKRLNIDGIKIYKVNPAYSSFIGNLQYEYTDAINASIEIARRGYEYNIKKNKKGFYPSLDVKHQWKEKIGRAHV